MADGDSAGGASGGIAGGVGESEKREAGGDGLLSGSGVGWGEGGFGGGGGAELKDYGSGGLGLSGSMVEDTRKLSGGADGIRTRVWSLKGTCPRPLDDSAHEGQNSSNSHALAKAKVEFI